MTEDDMFQACIDKWNDNARAHFVESSNKDSYFCLDKKHRLFAHTSFQVWHICDVEETYNQVVLDNNRESIHHSTFKAISYEGCTTANSPEVGCGWRPDKKLANKIAMFNSIRTMKINSGEDI